MQFRRCTKNDCGLILVYDVPSARLNQVRPKVSIRRNNCPLNSIPRQNLLPTVIEVVHLVIFTRQRLAVKIRLTIYEDFLRRPHPIQEIAAPCKIVEHLPFLWMFLKPACSFNRKDLRIILVAESAGIDGNVSREHESNTNDDHY